MEMHRLPLGCYFHPKPHDCIEYLSCKVYGKKKLSWAGLIFERDPYDPEELHEIFLVAETRENLYLFTKLQRRSKSSSIHINRTVGNGIWHGAQTKKVRDADNNTVIGTVRTFTYWEDGSINDRRFLMTEYQLPSKHGGYDPLKHHVLCHIRCHEGKRGNNSNNRNSGSQQVPSTSDAPVQVYSNNHNSGSQQVPSTSDAPVQVSSSSSSSSSSDSERTESD